MDLNLLDNCLYPGWEEGWPLCFLPGEFSRILDRKTEVDKSRSKRSWQSTRNASSVLLLDKAPSPLPTPQPECPGGAFSLIYKGKRIARREGKLRTPRESSDREVANGRREEEERQTARTG